MLSTAWVSATKQAYHTLILSTAWVSATNQAYHTLMLSTAWVSATNQASHTLKLSIAWVSATNQAYHTLNLSIAWVPATRQAYHTLKLFNSRCGGRRVQTSLLLSPVPTLWKKGTENKTKIPPGKTTKSSGRYSTNPQLTSIVHRSL